MGAVMRFLSVCSGIEAASAAWRPLGWEAASFSEIEAFPRAVLKHHYPDIPLHGDFTTIKGDEYGPIGLLCGGTPCQSFSIAGLRKGMDDDRGNLALEFLRLAERTGAKWLLWENVPGVLSSNGGRDFGSILGGLGELGYGFAYRILDAQHFGVPQRRRRVFVVGYLGDWRRAAAVLFERHCLQGNSPPRRETGQVAPTVPSRSTVGGGLGTDFDCDGGLVPQWWDGSDTATSLTTRSNDQQMPDKGNFAGIIAPTVTSKWAKGSGGPAGSECGKQGAFSAKDHSGDAMEDCSPTLRAGGHSKSHANAGVMPAVAFDTTQITSRANYSNPKPGDPCHPLAAGAHPPAIASSTVRRLTPRECERLMGFPDDYTRIPYRGKPAELCPDGPRYKALGNSWAVPCVRWIGERIQMVEGVAS